MERFRTRTTTMIRRMGQPMRILRKSGGTTNQFGKIEGDSWAGVAEEYGVLNLRGGRAGRQMYTSGGEFDQNTPHLTLQYDSVAKDGDRVEIGGITYELQTLVALPTHKTAALVSVNGEL